MAYWVTQLPSRIYNIKHFFLPAGLQMPLCLLGEMMGMQKTVLIVNLPLVTKKTNFSLWKPPLSANVFGAFANNDFVCITWMTWFIWQLFLALRSSAFSPKKSGQATCLTWTFPSWKLIAISLWCLSFVSSDSFWFFWSYLKKNLRNFVSLNLQVCKTAFCSFLGFCIRLLT